MKKSTKDTQMKKSLGRILFVLLTFLTLLQAKELATYSLTTDKTTLYEKEAFVVTFIAQQKDSSDNMMFLLQPKQSDDYTIELLNKTIDDSKYHTTKTTFSYLVFGLKPKDISIDFDFTVQTASDKAVAHSYVDDHDDSIAIQTQNTKIKVKPLHIKIKKLEHDVDLVGDFHLTEKIDKSSLNQYDSLNIIYTLSGKGYKKSQLQLLNNIDGVSMFSEINTIYKKASKRGYAIKQDYIYALSAKKDFTIPAVSLKAFSPRNRQYYTLTTKSHAIHVTKIDTTKLLDKEEFPAQKSYINSAQLKQFFIYLIIFISGYMTARLQPWSFQKKASSIELDAVKQSNTPKRLLDTLLHQHLQNKFSHEIELLEEIVYNDANHNFKSIKKKILKGL